MRRLALTRRLEEAFPDIPSEVFFKWIEEGEIHSTLGYTILCDKQGLALGFKKHDGTPIDPADPLVAGYWASRKQNGSNDTLEAFQARDKLPKDNLSGSQDRDA